MRWRTDTGWDDDDDDNVGGVHERRQDVEGVILCWYYSILILYRSVWNETCLKMESYGCFSHVRQTAQNMVSLTRCRRTQWNITCHKNTETCYGFVSGEELQNNSKLSVFPDKCFMVDLNWTELFLVVLQYLKLIIEQFVSRTCTCLLYSTKQF